MSHGSRAHDPVAVRPFGFAQGGRRHLRLLAARGQNAGHSDTGEENDRRATKVRGSRGEAGLSARDLQALQAFDR